MRVLFIVPGDPDQRTGGYLYDAHMVKAMEASGIDVTVLGLAGQFPIPDEDAKHAMQEALVSVPSSAVVIIDGLALGGLGETVQATLAQRTHPKPRLIGLVHHPLADERGLDPQQAQWLYQQERLALSCCDQVIVTSPFTARRLIERAYVTQPPSVVTPGVVQSALAKSASDPSTEDEDHRHRFLCVASITPRKGHAVLLEALDAIRDLPWVCQWVGDHGRDPRHAQALTHRIDALELTDRIECLGELDEASLDVLYHQADVCVLPSWYEGYGMVVTESLARGLPMITTDGGALPDTLPQGAGLIVPAGDAHALAQALSSWCQDAELRETLRTGAKRARANLNSWHQSGQRFIEALGLSTLEPNAPK